MTRRQVLEVKGVAHGAPIPMGVRMGNLLFTSAVMGTDPETSTLPPEPERQAELAFSNLAALLEQAGSSPADVAKMDVLIKDNDMRPHVNRHWLEWYPHEDDRPARHTTVQDLPGQMLIQLEVVAVVGGAGA